MKTFTSDIRASIQAATEALKSKQRPDGSWAGEVELNPGPTAQTVMLFAATRENFPEKISRKAERYILRTQNADGGWSPHFGAPSEVALSIECYVALRLLGVSEQSSACIRARSQISILGGIAKANPWTQLYLGVLGIVPWTLLPRVPIEILLISRLMPLQIDDLAYWVKVITIPMILLGAVGPGQPVELAFALSSELEVKKIFSLMESAPHWLKNITAIAGKAASTKIPFIREKAVARALELVDAFTEESGDLGGNSCTAMNVLMSLNCLGRKESPAFKRGLEALLKYAIETDSEWHMQTCQSLVWDTGFALSALPSSEKASVSGRDWLKRRQILDVKGPWARNVSAEPGGWCFGNHHDHFPVTDCTGLALLALSVDTEFVKTSEARKAIKWLIEFQHEQGGWSAYEKYRPTYKMGEWLDRYFKFKDIPNALSDLPKNDVSAKVLECLATYRDQFPELKTQIESSIKRGRKYLIDSRIRIPSGEMVWMGNYGVNTLYGTAFSAKALKAISRPLETGKLGGWTSDWAEDVRAFLSRSQNSDGGWGEVEESYRATDLAGRGDSNPVQTSWALLGYCSALESENSVDLSEDSKKLITKGVQYLMQTQKPEGGWDQQAFLGTVFPGAVYFKYELYSFYFPLIALRSAQKYLDENPEAS